MGTSGVVVGCLLDDNDDVALFVLAVAVLLLLLLLRTLSVAALDGSALLLSFVCCLGSALSELEFEAFLWFAVVVVGGGVAVAIAAAAVASVRFC